VEAKFGVESIKEELGADEHPPGEFGAKRSNGLSRNFIKSILELINIHGHSGE
jgi:hypothetical protein